MRKNNIRFLALAIVSVFVFVFQNCSNPSGGFSLNDNGTTSTPSTSPSPSVPNNVDEQQLKSMQQTYLTAKQNPGSTIDELNATIQILTQLLGQITNYPTDGLSQALLLFRTQVMEDISTEIQVLQDEVTQLQNASPSPSPSPAPSATPSPTPDPSISPSPSPTASPTPSPSPTSTPTPSPTPSPSSSITCTMSANQTISKKGKDIKNYDHPVNVADPSACLAVCESYNHAGICTFVYHSANNPQNGGQCTLNTPQDTDGAQLYSGDSSSYAGYCQ